MYRTVLVPLDGSPLAERALPYALVVAKASEARLLLVRAVPGPGAHTDGHDPAQSSRLRDAEQYLIDFSKHVTQPFVVETTVFTGDAADAIIEEITLRQVDVVVMSTHGRSGLGRWVYGSVADQIMRRASVPVVLVPARVAGSWPCDRAPRVLVPLDGSNLSRSTLDLISGLIDALHAEVRLLQVIVPRPYTYAGAAAYLAFDPAADTEAVREYLTAVAKDYGARGWSIAVESAFGLAASMITLAARKDGADLIALSTHGAGGLTRLLMGSVAAGVVQQASVPILILRPSAASIVDETAMEKSAALLRRSDDLDRALGDQRGDRAKRG